MLKLLSRPLAATFLGLWGTGCAPQAKAVPPLGSAIPAPGISATKLVQTGGRWQLMRDGKPYLIQGGGGGGSLALLKERGGNSNRTWGSDNIESKLDEAQKLGLTYTVGIWLGHTEHGFDYSDEKAVAKQLEKAKSAIDRYKNHPAVLAWGIGNEMEGFKGQTDPKMWAAVQQIAAYAHQADPNHPTMTVIAEIGGDKVASINKFCPDIDIVGINSYGGAPSLPGRYLKAGGVKPYILTEFGPPGTWETGKTSWGAARELTSSEKAKVYAATWNQAIKNQPLALGGYAFTWGNKQEATATWYGLLLSGGELLGPVDALTQIWTGQPPRNQAPVIESLKLETPEMVAPGATVKASLKVSDPNRDALKVQWVLQHDPLKDSVGGAAQATPPTYPAAIQSASNSEVTLKMPELGGGYRLFAFIRDGKGSAAVGNLPLFVEGGDKTPAAPAPIAAPKTASGTIKANLPLQLLVKANGALPFEPSGYMGKSDTIQMSETLENSRSGKAVLKAQYSAPGDWGGVVWQSPANDWGDKPGGWDLSGAKKLTFWARGAQGGEIVNFSYGVLGADKKYSDSDKGETGKVKLGREWDQYVIGLAGKDLTHIKTGFCWVVAGNGQLVTFYLDDIKFE